MPWKGTGVSRTFSRGIDDLQDLHGALSSYGEWVAKKIGKNGLRAGVMNVYAVSNRFHKTDFCHNKTTFRFPVPTSGSPEMIKGPLPPAWSTFLISAAQTFYILPCNYARQRVKI
ncbi:DinB/UmuC family translesion DNA polymerase [Desulfoluna spongiiphila]|uniref:DinB/UmuC family translesion DNA polymerase n=1 Tax=Desulfoluna spongiiphila TaxID=419481 RepID=UPI00349ED121